MERPPGRPGETGLLVLGAFRRTVSLIVISHKEGNGAETNASYPESVKKANAPPERKGRNRSSQKQPGTRLLIRHSQKDSSDCAPLTAAAARRCRGIGGFPLPRSCRNRGRQISTPGQRLDCQVARNAAIPEERHRPQCGMSEHCGSDQLGVRWMCDRGQQQHCATLGRLRTSSAPTCMSAERSRPPRGGSGRA